MSEKITSTPESLEPALPAQDYDRYIENNGKTVAYLLPGENGSGLNLIIDPTKVPNIAEITDETKQEPMIHNLEIKPSRLTNDLEDSLKLEVTDSEILPISILNRESEDIFTPSNVGWIENEEEVPESESVENDLALYGRKRNGELVNVTNWLSLHIEGSKPRLNDPELAKYLGALIAREVREDEKAPHKALLEDHLTKHQESITLVDEENGYDSASKITEEYHTSDLGEAIRMDRDRLSHRAKRIGHFVATKIEQIVPSSKNEHDDRLIAA